MSVRTPTPPHGISEALWLAFLRFIETEGHCTTDMQAFVAGWKACQEQEQSAYWRALNDEGR